jgi:hypothetical protein
LLGQPIVSKAEEGRVERIYRSSYAFVMATAPSENRGVGMFSITIRNRKYRPRLRFDTGKLTADSLDVDLSRAHFSDFSGNISGRRCIIGARRSGYAELYYFGNPGYYQQYLLAYNDGAGDTPAFPENFPSFGSDGLAKDAGYEIAEGEPPAELLAQVRRSLRVNTIVISDGTADIAWLSGYRCTGFDQDSIRQIPE